MASVRVDRRWPLALVAVALIAGCGTAQQPTLAAPTTTPARPASAVTVVKVDDVAAARPATGLGAARVVYVEPVEGGLTRIAAVFGGRVPAVVGPVRSARPTDIGLLGQWGRPAFAYSGSAPQLRAALRSAPLVNAAQSDVPHAYFRRSTHRAPHNLYVHPGQLPVGTGPAVPAVTFGPPPSGGVPSTDERIRYPAASFEFRWSPGVGRWLVWQDGTPLTSTDAGQLGAATVVVQSVTMSTAGFRDSAGSPVPVANTVGTGPATVLRGGVRFAATWSRPSATAPTRFTVTRSGQPLPMATGQVWVLLVAR
ncbi:MAG TPA: DUF3048 domain-containing protein [Pseudonocardiaceae bacterium]|nr:DUF3048 domain-containing protein [Pseudonocardiaceae bacterium]